MLFSACAILSALLNFIKFCPPLLPVLLFVSFFSSVTPPSPNAFPFLFFFFLQRCLEGRPQVLKECAGDNHPTAVPIMESLRWITVKLYCGEALSSRPLASHIFANVLFFLLIFNFLELRLFAKPLPGTTIIQKQASLATGSLLSLQLKTTCQSSVHKDL